MKKIIPLLFFLMALAVFAPSELSAASRDATPQGEKIAARDEKTSSFIRKAVEDYLNSRLSDQVSEWKIVEINYSITEKIPIDFSDYTFNPTRPLRGGHGLYGNIEFTDNGQIIKSIPVNARIEITTEVATAKARISRGAVISEEMVSMQKMKIDGAPEDLCTDLATIVGQVAGKNILAGRAIEKSNLTAPVDVKAGDLVALVAERDGIRLTARGIAKKDGTIGELIPVVNLRSNKKLFGRVTEPGTVKVAF